MSRAARKENHSRGHRCFSGCVDKCITGGSATAGRGRTAGDGPGMDTSPNRGVGPCRRGPPASNAKWGSTRGEPDAYGRREMYKGGTAGVGARETDDPPSKGYHRDKSARCFTRRGSAALVAPTDGDE